jgi:hypothetical protein
LACGILTFITIGIPSASQAQTNSWIQSGDGAWQNSANWSLSQAPTNTQSLVISNNLTKIITIDSTTSGSFSNTLTVSDVIISSPADALNILDLSNAGTNTPLNVLNNFIITSGLLRLTGSGLWMQINTNAALTNATSAVLSNGVLDVEYALQLNNNSCVAADTGLYVGLDTNANGLVSIVGGQLLLTNTLPSAIGVNGYGEMDISSGQVQTVANFLFVGSGIGSQGTLSLLGGNLVASPYARLVVGMETGAVGVVSVTGGNLIMTNSLMTLVGGDGSGQLNLSGGTNIFGATEVGGDSGSQGTLTMAGGINTFQSGLYVGSSLGATGAVWLTGGQLIATNLATCIGSWGYGVATVSNGSWIGNAMLVGVHGFANITNNLGSITTPAQASYGAVDVNGGTMTLYSKLVLGNCPTGGVGVVNVTGGNLYVTNAAHNAFIDVRDGQLILAGGTAQVDNLVLTNGCGSFLHTGGTLVAGNVVFNTNSFRIVSVTPQGNDILITWQMAAGITNALQAAGGKSDGSCGTNGFTDIFVVTNNSVIGSLTNYLDVGAATNSPARYYRARVAF